MVLLCNVLLNLIGHRSFTICPPHSCCCLQCAMMKMNIMLKAAFNLKGFALKKSFLFKEANEDDCKKLLLAKWYLCIHLLLVQFKATYCVVYRE